MTSEPLTYTALAAIGVLLALDIGADFGHGTGYAHIALEAVAFLIVAVVLSRAVSASTQKWFQRTTSLGVELAAAQRERDEWRARSRGAVEGLGRFIDEQFERWKLSPAERETALLILKGLSHKEIANVRQCSERTVRQQATNVYAKAGLTGKSSLAAFFLEDLIVPPAAHPAAEG